MKKIIYEFLASVPIVGGYARIANRLRQDLPPRWLFNRSVVNWTSEDKTLRGQLPVVYRFFGAYCGLFFKFIPSADYLSGGRYLLRVISFLNYMLTNNGYAMVVIGKYKVCLDLTDPRFLKVVNELKCGKVNKILSLFIGDGDTFVDVGANQGAFSIVASHLVGRNGKVVSIEPQARLASAIEVSLAASSASPYKVYQVAVGDYDGEVCLIVPRSYSGTAGIYKNFSGYGWYVESKVPIRRFDDLVDWKNFTGKVFIKLDIEGSERSFLKGASEMIAALRPNILMEINPNAMRASSTSTEDMKGLLKSLNYSTYSELENLREFRSVENLSAVPQRDILLIGSNKSV